MLTFGRGPIRRALVVLGCLMAAFVGARPGAGAEPEPVALPSVPAPPVPSEIRLSLPACLHLALERQPRIAAERASLAAAQDGLRALEELKLVSLLDSEIPVRRRQAALGMIAATAGVEQAERETVYAVTRAYLTVLYARAQERNAGRIEGRLADVRRFAQDQVNAEARNVTVADVDRTGVYLRLVKTRQVQASQGVHRARAALREALGLGPEVSVDVPAGEWRESQVTPNRDEVLALALTRRPELVRANTFAEVACLEAEAQATSCHLRMQTFAAGSDVHAVAVPQEVKNGEFRPGGVLPEMPTVLVGHRAERVQHAHTLHARAQALVEATRNLIAVEAEDALLRWEEASAQVPTAGEAANLADKLAEELNGGLRGLQKAKIEEVVNAWVLAAQARSQFNESLLHELLALADLERVTGGGFVSGLADTAAPADNK